LASFALGHIVPRWVLVLPFTSKDSHTMSQGSFVWRDHLRRIRADFSYCAQEVNDEVLHHAVRSFGFLVQAHESLSAAEFAQRIERVYDARNPQTAQIVASLRLCA
jgi:hypothetical protein